MLTLLPISDYNYQLDTDGSCSLVPGLEPPDHSKVCREDPDLVYYYKATGYRRVPLDTCQEGQELEFQPNEKMWCKGHKDEYDEMERKKGPHGFAFFFFVVLVPIGLAGAVGWWVWRNWDGKFGQIRLGDGGSVAGGRGSSLFDSGQPWIKYPIIGVSAVVAVVATVPLVVASGARWVMGLFGLGRGAGGYSYRGLGGSGGGGGLSGVGPGRYTSRSDFARGGRYAVVDPDEDELLGEDDEGPGENEGV